MSYIEAGCSMPGELPEVRVEFFGTARLHAGIADMILPVGAIRELMKEIQLRCPRLKLINEDGTLSGHFLLSLNGERFLQSLDEVILVEDSLLIMGADAGG